MLRAQLKVALGADTKEPEITWSCLFTDFLSRKENNNNKVSLAFSLVQPLYLELERSGFLLGWLCIPPSVAVAVEKGREEGMYALVVMLVFGTGIELVAWEHLGIKFS